MFPLKKYILYISPKTIVVATADDASGAKKGSIGKSIPWVKETLPKTLLDIKKDTSGPFDVILDDDLTFVFAVTIPADATNEREVVRIKMAETLPQETGDNGWDFKEILEGADTNEKVVQCAAVESNFYSDFSTAVHKANIAIESMEPLVCSLARLRITQDQPELVIYSGLKTLAFVTYKGLVFSVLSFDDEPRPEAILKLLDFVKGKFSVIPKKIFIAGTFKHLSDTTKEFASYAVELGELDMFLGNAKKSDTGGKDELSLNILPVSVTETAEAKLAAKIVGTATMSSETGVGAQYKVISETGIDERYPQGKWFTILILISSFLIIVANGIISYQRIQVDRIVNAPSPLIVAPIAVPVATSTEMATTTSTTTSTEVVTPEVLDKAAYTIEILNGSGVRGATQTAKRILEAAGFRVVKVGNADTFDYPNTIVQYKDSVSGVFRNAVEEELLMGYTIQQGSTIDLDGKVDVIITLGKK